MRNLIFFLLLWFFLWWLRSQWQHFKQRQRAKPTKPDPTPQTEQIVACAYCGLHVPESESLRAGKHVFCCKEHMRLGTKD